MCFGGGGGSARLAAQQAQQARQDQQAREQNLNLTRQAIDQAFSQFNDDFYKQRGQAYVDYATPQLNDQFTNAQKMLTYALSRSGNLQSSVAADKYADLGRQYAGNDQAIQENALNLENATRRDVEANRADTLGQFTSGENSDAAGAAASARANLETLPPQFSPLGALFTNITGTLANRANQTGNPSIPGTFGARLFGGGSPSYTVS